MHGAATHQLEIFPRVGPAIGPRQLVFRAQLFIIDVGDHAAADRGTISWPDSRIPNWPIVPTLDHRHTQTVASLRIYPALGKPPCNSAAGGSSTHNQYVVVLSPVARLSG